VFVTLEEIVDQNDSAEAVSARMAIEDLARRYAHGIDGRNWEQVDSCFASDASVRGTTFEGPYPQYMASLRGAVEKYRTTMHFFGNQLTEVDGDTGHCVTYGIAYHLGSGTGDDFVIGVRYLDDVARSGARWLIRNRTVQGVWRQPLGGDVLELATP